MIIHLDTTRFIWEVLENNEYACVFKELVVLDAGCNIGAFSLWIYPLASKIYAVDMVDSYLDDFRKTIQDNELKNITLYKERLLNLSEFMSGHAIDRVDVLKLDVEGDEVEILSNDFPKDKVRVIVGEYHNRPVKDYIERLGYRYYEYPNQHFVARI